jgi:hypothetical protein
VPIGPNQRLKRNMNKQWMTRAVGAKVKRFCKIKITLATSADRPALEVCEAEVK